MKILKYTSLLFPLLILSLYPQKRAFTIEDLYRVKDVGTPVLSPSENRIAFVVTEYNLKEGKSNSDIYVMNSDGSKLNRITNTEESESDPMWNNEDELFYLKGSSLYLYSLTKGASEELVSVSSGISGPVLSPDRRLIAFATNIYPECGADNDCNSRLSKLAEEGPLQAIYTDSLMFRHWTSYAENKVAHIFLYDIGRNQVRDLAASPWASSDYMLGGSLKYAFSPDSREVCFMNTPEDNLAITTNADLYIIPVQGGTPQNITIENKAWDGSPVYSQDGKYIAYRKQVIPDYEADRWRIALYDRETGEHTTLTEDFDYTTTDAMCWNEESNSIYFTADYQGYSPVYCISPEEKIVKEVTDKKSVFGFDLGQSLFYMAKTVGIPSEIYRMEMGNKSYSQLTFFNKELLDEVDIRPAEQIWVEGADGKKVHCFIVKPHGFDETKRYPLILNVHGGPQGQWMDSFRGDWQVYPGSGYIVAFPNPHGSTGFGSEYTAAISGDYGGKVFEDLMLLTDELEKLPYVDKERMGAMGWSYGGYMMNWFQGHTKRFKCLASMMGIYDQESMWGATEELWFVNWDFEGQPWDSDLYEEWTPSNFVKNFSTPALIITGERDYRVPYTQSIQYFTTLQTLGIDSRLIIFKNDGHWPSFVKSMPLYYNAHLEWFHKYLGGGPAPYDSREMVKNTVFKN